MEEFLEFTILGLSLGAVYAVAASGLVLTYTTTGIFNFAHGAIGMFGAFTYWQLRFDWGWPAPLALLVVLVVLGPGLGALLELVIWRGLEGTSEATRIVVSISLLVALIGFANVLWDPNVGRLFPKFFEGSGFELGPTNVTWHETTTVLIAIGVAILLRFLLYRTRSGVAMRATVDDRSLAALNGARPNVVAMLSWGIGCSLAALSGVLVGPTLALSATVLPLLIVNAYAAAMFGRLRSLPLTFVGAVGLGLLVNYVRADFFDWFEGRDYLSSFEQAVPVIVLFVVLLVLPGSRLRGHTSRAREHFATPTWPVAIAGAVAVVAIAAGVGVVAASDSVLLEVGEMFGLAIIALSLVPLVGYAGQISLCQLSFAGIGAITMAHLGGDGTAMGYVYAMLVAGAVGALIALPALRLSGIYLALATAAFAVALDRWIFKLESFTVFGVELRFFEQSSVRVGRLDLPGVTFDSARANLMLLATVFAALGLFVVWLRRGRFGQRLLAMKDSEAACATLGMSLTRTKLAVFAISAAIAGLGGALYAGTRVAVGPDEFSFVAGLPVFMLTVVGGIGSVAGAAFAGIALTGFVVIPRVFPVLEDLMRVTPGLLGIGLGRNPNGVVSILAERWDPVRRRLPVLVGLVAVLAGLWGLAALDMVSNWAWLLLSLAAAIVAARAAEAMTPDFEADRIADSSPADMPVELIGVDRPATEHDRDAFDRELGVSEAQLSGAS